jgi:uncharacterized membrane protein YagU involved in acid resistance
MRSSYSSTAATRAILIAMVIAGTLEILAAFAFAIMAGGSPLGVLRGIGGAFLDSEAVGPITLAVAGLVLHFAIVTVMATVYLVLAGRIGLLNRLAVLSGVGYGLILWGVMCWVILPWRWPTLFPVTDRTEVAMQLFSHVVLVGIPIALVARSATRWRFTADLM